MSVEGCTGSCSTDGITAVSVGGAEILKLREAAVERLQRLPFPDGNNELWRYTKPGQIPFDLLKKANITVAPNFSVWRAKDGVELPDGVSSLSDKAASSKLADKIAAIEGWEEQHGDAVSALQLSSITSFSGVNVKKGSIVTQPLLLSYLAGSSTSGSCVPLIVVDVEERAEVTIIDDLAGIDGGSALGLVAPRIEIFIGSSAKVNFISLLRPDDSAAVLGRHGFHLGRGAKLNSAHLALNGAVTRVDIDLNLAEPEAQASMIGIALGDKKRHVDFHTTQWHNAPHCRSDLFFKGVVKDKARSVYYGYIRVAEGAQRTDAYQTSRTLLMSQTARADSIPNLEIKANDVKCSHGASVSHVNKEELFYLMTRGLSQQTAEKVIVEGFLEDLLGRVENPEVHAWLSELVLGRLGSATVSC